MPLYTPELYCQEVWDLGRAIEKFNTYLRTEYWEICDPKATRLFYKVLRNNINLICREDFYDDDDDVLEEDLFSHFSQSRFQKFFNFTDTRTIQFPYSDKLRPYVYTIIDRLRDLNNWFETPVGQAANWRRVHQQFKENVIQTWWNQNELMNYIPDDEEAEEEQQMLQVQANAQAQT